MNSLGSPRSFPKNFKRMRNANGLDGKIAILKLAVRLGQ
jgi:hypothetical protein